MKNKSAPRKDAKKIFYPKKCQGTFPKNLCTETFTEKKGRSPTPKTTRWISFAKKKHLHLKKKDAPKNTWTETVYQKNSEESHQNKSEERSLPKTFRRDISSKKINVFEEKFLPKKKRKSYKNSKQKIICRKTTQRKLCIFPREISTKQNLKGYL